MNDIRKRKRDGSLDQPRDSIKNEDYFDKVDDGVLSEAARSKPRKSLKYKNRSSKSNLSEGMGLAQEMREEERKLYGETRKRSSQNREDIEEQALSESTDMFQIDRLLQNFDPNDFLIPPTNQELIYLFFLKLRAKLPFYTTMLVIYGIGFTYLFTYMIPLVSKSYNDRYKFLIEDSDRLLGIYSKDPNPFHWIFIVLPYICCMILVTISLYRASTTTPGTISKSEEWDIRMTTGSIQSLDLCNRNRQSLLRNIDGNESGIVHLKNIGKQRYFELNEGGITDVKLKSFARLSDPSTENEMRDPDLLSKTPSVLYSRQMLCGVEECLENKFKKKYQKKVKQLKAQESHQRSEPNLHQINPDEMSNPDEGEGSFGNGNRFSEDTPLTIDMNEQDRKTIQGLFPVFVKTFETKKDGTPRICIKCLKRKCDRCHHCSICNTCILMMDHHCPWINNCIGYFNYKYFFLLINYCMLSTVLINLTYWETFQSVMSEDKVSNACLIWVCINFLLSMIMGFILVLFCAFHVRLLVTNYTTLEYCEKKREKESTWQISPFDKGSAWGNVQTKLGYDKFIFLPTTPNLLGNGTVFEIKHHFMNEELDIDHDDMMQDEIHAEIGQDQDVSRPQKVKVN